MRKPKPFNPRYRLLKHCAGVDELHRPVHISTRIIFLICLDLFPIIEKEFRNRFDLNPFMHEGRVIPSGEMLNLNKRSLEKVSPSGLMARNNTIILYFNIPFQHYNFYKKWYYQISQPHFSGILSYEQHFLLE